MSGANPSEIEHNVRGTVLVKKVEKRHAADNTLKCYM
jgi:hypothetical protein